MAYHFGNIKPPGPLTELGGFSVFMQYCFVINNIIAAASERDFSVDDSFEMTTEENVVVAASSCKKQLMSLSLRLTAYGL